MTTGDVEQLNRDVRLGRGGPPITWTQMVEDPSPRRPPSGGAAEGHDRTVTERISVTAPPVTVTRTVTAPAAPATP
jgi:hypothetical protein